MSSSASAEASELQKYVVHTSNVAAAEAREREREREREGERGRRERGGFSEEGGKGRRTKLILKLVCRLQGEKE
jgi:hypothetical protein